jgi:hypothetical protein
MPLNISLLSTACFKKMVSLYFIQIFFHYLLIFILKYFRSYVIFGIFCDIPGNKFNHQLNKINIFFIYHFFRKFFQTGLKLNIISTLKLIPARVFTHPLITKHE